MRDALPAGASLRDLGEHRLQDLQRPEQVFQLLHPDLPADFPPLRSLDALPNNLPRQLTSFVGREQEMAEVKRLLAATRLLTLTGVGRRGKTRLALQVAAELLEAYPDGVWLVELAPLADPALVPQTVAAALGVREEPGTPARPQTLADYLQPEAAAAGAGQLRAPAARPAPSWPRRLLRACPQLRILATSREGLGIAGETDLPGAVAVAARSPAARRRLETPAPQYEAVRLFVERASAEPARLRRDATRTRRRWRRSASGWTASRWRSSWRRRG